MKQKQACEWFHVTFFSDCIDLKPRICAALLPRCSDFRNIAFLYTNCKRTCAFCWKMVSVLNKITGVFTIIVEGATKHFSHWHLDFLTLTLGGKENEFLFTSLRIFSVWRNAIVNMQFKLHSTSSVSLFPVISFENYFLTVYINTALLKPSQINTRF